MIKLSMDEKAKLIEEIQTFFAEERDEEIGIIAGEIVLDFFMENMGKTIYNKALGDAKFWFANKLSDVEFSYDDLYK